MSDNAFELIESTKPYVVKETTIPDKGVIRILRMSDGAINVYWGKNYIGSVVHGDDTSLCAILEQATDMAYEKGQRAENKRVMEVLQSSTFILTINQIVRYSATQRKSFFERLFG